ncbi:hypothetical protein DPMN_083625 [Dreissena polymorpha]|uniref:Uncharacterized protein n=1 Tax=Dreissena polymorpha TaxID=45954 RepID=A0A9D3YCA8_DREPO|nr:hypothetical protein DPMN_083625 [Dreissena polymorpha]
MSKKFFKLCARMFDRSGLGKKIVQLGSAAQTQLGRVTKTSTKPKLNNEVTSEQCNTQGKTIPFIDDSFLKSNEKTNWTWPVEKSKKARQILCKPQWFKGSIDHCTSSVRSGAHKSWGWAVESASNLQQKIPDVRKRLQDTFNRRREDNKASGSDESTSRVKSDGREKNAMAKIFNFSKQFKKIRERKSSQVEGAIGVKSEKDATETGFRKMSFELNINVKFSVHVNVSKKQELSVHAVDSADNEMWILSISPLYSVKANLGTFSGPKKIICWCCKPDQIHNATRALDKDQRDRKQKLERTLVSVLIAIIQRIILKSILPESDVSEIYNLFIGVPTEGDFPEKDFSEKNDDNISANTTYVNASNTIVSRMCVAILSAQFSFLASMLGTNVLVSILLSVLGSLLGEKVGKSIYIIMSKRPIS